MLPDALEQARQIIEAASIAAQTPAEVVAGACSSCDGAGVVVDGGSFELCPLCKGRTAPLGQKADQDATASPVAAGGPFDV